MKTKKEVTLFDSMFVLLMVCMMALYTCMSMGFVLLKAWEWFILPVLDAPILTWANCIGLFLFVNVLKLDLSKRKKGTLKDAVYDAIFVPWIALGVLYVASLLI